jgi:hypothetical protein
MKFKWMIYQPVVGREENRRLNNSDFTQQNTYIAKKKNTYRSLCVGGLIYRHLFPTWEGLEALKPKKK